ncbi:SDR family NAD(P)-dependent oxidoreductase [Herbiconiux sp. L3-i23]|uniref:SDR family NAD(P)-dependent oxidoreductase n=1 Tax=Herbiconiux sp. L3-i23 TaxID=2905871 RepID=UPI002055AA1E|nr:SDR family NAD(P)-dependent oxidoreductase [Herbiconiux sp. L3-i23]BDI23493.1 short-chain dehydrogenase [Herbiconiux sp. L3-i23]
MSAGRFDGRVALVTGAAGAIGSAVAARLAAEGARLVLTDLDDDRLSAIALDLRGARTDVETVAADLSTEAGARSVIERGERRFGRLDVAALIAGISGPRVPVDELPADAWDAVIGANLRSMFLSLRFSAAAMIRSGSGGSIVTMSSSMAQWDVLDGGSAYAASKGGVLAFTRASAFDLAPHGIRVNAVCPGVIDTQLGVPTSEDGDFVAPTSDQFAHRIPLRKIGATTDVAAAVAYLASDDAGHVTGSELLIDGGQTLQSWANSPREG